MQMLQIRKFICNKIARASSLARNPQERVGSVYGMHVLQLWQYNKEIKKKRTDRMEKRASTKTMNKKKNDNGNKEKKKTNLFNICMTKYFYK